MNSTLGSVVPLAMFCKKLQSLELLFVFRVILGSAGHHGGHAVAQQMVKNIEELL